MNKYTFLLTALLSTTCVFKSFAGDMPFYEDDEKFEQCVKATGKPDNCTREEMLRTLEEVKREYRSILTNPAITEWHPQLEENTKILHDMYESWTAYRNRLCLLSYEAGSYMKPKIDERYSCNLYYTMHQRAQLAEIINLLEKKVPAKRQDFHFLDISEHDKEFQACLQREDENTCFEAELNRSSEAVKNLYKTYITDTYLGKWNNGPNLQQGNYRDMYDSWIAYRNRFCQLAIWAYKRTYGEEAPQLGQCVLLLNREKTEAMRNLYMVAHSLQKKDIEDFDETVKAEQKAKAKRDTDGGEKTGKSIPPLQQRYDYDSNGTDDELVPTYQQPAAPQQPQPQPSNREIPAWARQK